MKIEEIDAINYKNNRAKEVKENVVKEKKKWSLKKKVLVTLSSLFVVGVASFLFIFYGPWAGFRNFWITSAMTTMSHQYLATWFYSDETIQKVLQSNSIVESNEVSNPDSIKFKKYTLENYFS